MALYKKSTIEVRAAKPEELEILQADLKKDPRWEQVDLSKGIVGVVTKDGEIVQYVQARMMWQIEPIKWMRGKKKLCSPFEQKKATLLSIRWIEGWLRDTRNNPYIRSYFCFIRDKTMQKLAKSFGMMRLYERGLFFGKDL